MYIPTMPTRDNRPAGDRCEVTLRDTFAAAALTWLASRPQWVPAECVPEAYRLADAMLRERLRNGALLGRETVQSVMPKEKRAEILSWIVNLTAQEREAIPWICGDVDYIDRPTAATLRGLLDRLA